MNYFKKQTLIFGWLSFAIATLVYILTMEPTSSLWDCSEFIATSYKMQIGHPPGAPLFMMINRIFTIFAPDSSSVAAMVNLSSAVASGFTILFLFWTIAHLARRIMRESEATISKEKTWLVVGASLVGALGYAFTDTFWFSAVEGEVYAQSSLFTALVFWAILKWENVAGEPNSNRWLVFVAYIMGLSIGIHLLNLLAIPAMVFIYYYKFNPNPTKAGLFKALALSIVILGSLLYIAIPKTIEIGAIADRIFVNSFGLPVNSGLATFFVLVLGGLIYGAWRTFKSGKVVLNTIFLCLSVIMLGYSTYATVIIRSSAKTPMNSNQPDDPYSLLSFLNREQYGDNPLIYGQTFASPTVKVNYKTGYRYNDETKKYDKVELIDGADYAAGSTMLFPRMWDSAQADNYRNWVNIRGKRIRNGEEMVVVPTFGENLQYFFNYQLNFMYWRYFLWNFVGRQNDIQSQGDILYGNWLSGITPIDEFYLGPQSNLPDDLENNIARNRYYFLPFLLGMLGLYFQLKHDKNNFVVVMWLFFMTGIAIILYLNQPPMQPRERDYVFGGSFYAFSIWIGLGVMWINEALEKIKNLSNRTRVALSVVISMVVPTILIAENWDDHDRSGRFLARDLGQNYLESTKPNAIIMPYGDNDTFPLWYNQEVEGVRRDARVMNFSYLESDWYVEQMRNKTYESEPVEFTLPNKFYIDNSYVQILELAKDPMTIKQVLEFLKSDNSIRKALRQQFGADVVIPTRKILVPVNKPNAVKAGIITEEEAALAADTITINLTGEYLTRSKMALLDVLGTADWSRPISITQPMTVTELGLKNYLQSEGYSYRIVPIKTEVKESMNVGRINSDELYDVVMNKFKFGNINDPDVTVDYFNSYNIDASQTRNVFGRLAKQLISEGDTIRAVEVLDKVQEKIPSSKVKHSFNSDAIIDAYYLAGETEKGDAILKEFSDNVISHLEYYATFSDRHANGLSSAYNEKLINVNNIYVLASRYKRHDITERLEPYMEIIRELYQ